MSIRDICFSDLYRKKDNVLNNFYIPALSEAKVYKRVSGYFSADVLKLYSQGLSSFVKKGGKIKFVFSHHLTEEDFKEIQKGYDGRFDDELLNSIRNIPDDAQISNLAYLISIGVIEIKIGFMVPGMLHFKYGLLEDGEDIVCFRGSTNETPAGLLINGENFEVSCSWKCGETEKNKINGYEKDFDDLWNNNYDGVQTVDAPDCVVSEITSHARNQIVIDYEDQCINNFLFDLDKNNKLVGYSFLNNKSLLSTSSIFYKTKFKYSIDRVEGENTYFFKELKPVEIKTVIETLKSHGQANGFEVNVSNRLINYLDSMELYLNKRTKLGSAIKEKDECILEEFNKFKEIVDEEFERKLALPQIWDAFHASCMISSSNFSVPGTGKTAISYGLFAYLSSSKINKVKRIIMVGPKNSFMAWKNEFSLCFGKKRTLKCFNIQDPSYKSTNGQIAGLIKEYSNSNLILINYDKLQNNEVRETLAMLMRQSNFSDLLVFDEAHKIKNPHGKRSAAALYISQFAKYKFVLTGTPIPNSYVDIYNMLHVLYGNDYDNFFGFSELYLNQASFIPSRQEEINKKIYPFFCRTTKKDLNVPPATFNYDSGYRLMSDREQELFKILYRYYSGNVLLLYIKLLQASINPPAVLCNLEKNDIVDLFGDEEEDLDLEESEELNYYKKTLVNKTGKNKIVFAPDDIEFIRDFGFTEKFYAGIDIIEKLTSEGKSVVAWGVFVKTLNAIQCELRKKGISSVVISGSMPLEERELNIKKFLNGDFQVLISNPHTLAESVSLHYVCHDAVYFEYSFNLTHMLQSRDRIHRFGLPQDTVTTYYFLSLDNDGQPFNSVDIRTLERLSLKEERMVAAIETKQLLIKDDSFMDDINFIFGK